MTGKRIYIALISLFVAGVSAAQQVPQFTQYGLSGYSFNPAFAGSKPYFLALATHRSQWTGITDAPRTYFLGVHAPNKNQKMGFGGSLFTDVAGPTRRTGAKATYAYHLDISSSSKLAFGLSFGMVQFSIDGSQIKLRDPSDQALTNAMQSELQPDASFGALWYGEKFRVGLSAEQILNNKIDLYPGEEAGRMAVHYYFTGAYKIRLADDFEVEPMVLAKYVSPVDPQFDVSAAIYYKSNLWLGGTYRTNDAIAVFAGYEIQDYLTIGYSYDFTTSDIQNYSDGTHEIVLRVRFAKKQMTEADRQTTD